MNVNRIGLAAVAVAGAAGLAVGLLAGRPAAGEQPYPVAQPQQRVSQTAPAAPRYRLTGYEGKLAVFVIGKQEPELIFDVYLHHLPDVDRLQLEQGIEVEDYERLLRLIEDFTS